MPETLTPNLQHLATKASSQDEVRLTWHEDVLGRPALRIQPSKQAFEIEDRWVVLLPDIDLTDGVIAFDALGQSGPPQSNFLGVAFRALDSHTHEVVYFRPFNFRAEEEQRRIHAVQYVSYPEYSWFSLREEQPGKYEQSVAPAPDGDGWFSAKVAIDGSRVRVYVNDSALPSLEVETLTRPARTAVGLWVGPGQGGYFANVMVQPDF